ncbi:MAG TPA: hypothetical protein VI278_10860 [Nitrososphaeraceae archaeon]
MENSLHLYLNVPIAAVTAISLSPAQHNSCNNADEETTTKLIQVLDINCHLQ